MPAYLLNAKKKHPQQSWNQIEGGYTSDNKAAFGVCAD